MLNTRFQIIRVVYNAAVHVGYSIDNTTDTRNIDSNYKKVKRLWCYAPATGTSGPDYATNINVKFSKPLKIDGREIYPKDFDTFLLFPRPENENFISNVDGARAEGSLIEGEFTPNGLVDGIYLFYIVLELGM